MTDAKQRNAEWEAYWRRPWEDRSAASNVAWKTLKRQGVAAARRVMTDLGIPLLAPDFLTTIALPKGARPPTGRHLEDSIFYSSREVEWHGDRITIIHDSLPHPKDRPFRTEAERDAAQARIDGLRNAAQDLAVIRRDVSMHEFRYATPDSETPKLPSNRRLSRAAAVLEEAADCLKFRFDIRASD